MALQHCQGAAGRAQVKQVHLHKGASKCEMAGEGRADTQTLSDTVCMQQAEHCQGNVGREQVKQVSHKSNMCHTSQTGVT